ncbi:Imm12 family immunity protein [Alloprevotella tannerae]|uniref:Imm12 family immunity protein n=1 Tax=Alloprevotella tannerae TaxID=76122 RepID=UPI0036F1FF5C
MESRNFYYFLEQTFADLSALVEKKLKAARCDFDGEAFKESLSKSLMDLSSEKK